MNLESFQNITLKYLRKFSSDYKKEEVVVKTTFCKDCIPEDYFDFNDSFDNSFKDSHSIFENYGEGSLCDGCDKFRVSVTPQLLALYADKFKYITGSYGCEYIDVLEQVKKHNLPKVLKNKNIIEFIEKKPQIPFSYAENKMYKVFSEINSINERYRIFESSDSCMNYAFNHGNEYREFKENLLKYIEESPKEISIDVLNINKLTHFDKKRALEIDLKIKLVYPEIDESSHLLKRIESVEDIDFNPQSDLELFIYLNILNEMCKYECDSLNAIVIENHNLSGQKEDNIESRYLLNDLMKSHRELNIGIVFIDETFSYKNNYS